LTNPALPKLECCTKDSEKDTSLVAQIGRGMEHLRFGFLQLASNGFLPPFPLCRHGCGWPAKLPINCTPLHAHDPSLTTQTTTTTSSSSAAAAAIDNTFRLLATTSSFGFIDMAFAEVCDLPLSWLSSDLRITIYEYVSNYKMF
jgi:hypothetical protein